MEIGLSLTAHHNVKPVAIVAVFGDMALVGSEQHGSGELRSGLELMQIRHGT